MPLVKIHRRRERPHAESRQIIEAVHAALVEAFKIPDRDRHHLLFQHDADHFEAPPDRGPAFTLIEIVAFPGRSPDAKRALYRGIARRLGDLGIPPGDVFVILTDPPLENWSVRDGASSADAPPTFKLDV